MSTPMPSLRACDTVAQLPDVTPAATGRILKATPAITKRFARANMGK